MLTACRSASDPDYAKRARTVSLGRESLTDRRTKVCPHFCPQLLGRQDAVIPHVYRPRMAAAMEQLSAAVYQETTLSYREAEGARIRIAQINGCLMCQSYRIAEHLPAALQKMGSDEAPNIGKNRGEAPTEDFYKAVAIDWRASEVFSDRERLAIEYAERISLEPVPLPYDDAFWDRLHAHFDEGEDRRDLQHHNLDRDGAYRARAGTGRRLCAPARDVGGRARPGQNTRTRCARSHSHAVARRNARAQAQPRGAMLGRDVAMNFADFFPSSK